MADVGLALQDVEDLPVDRVQLEIVHSSKPDS